MTAAIPSPDERAAAGRWADALAASDQWLHRRRPGVARRRASLIALALSGALAIAAIVHDINEFVARQPAFQRDIGPWPVVLIFIFVLASSLLAGAPISRLERRLDRRQRKAITREIARRQTDDPEHGVIARAVAEQRALELPLWLGLTVGWAVLELSLAASEGRRFAATNGGLELVASIVLIVVLYGVPLSRHFAARGFLRSASDGAQRIR
jgi:hypothetical protein